MSANFSSPSGVFLLDNPYFSAGAGLLGIGTLFALLRQGSLRYAMFLKRQLFTTLEINSKDKAYGWVLPYLCALQKQRASSKKSSLFDAILTPANHLSVQTTFIQRENGATETSFTMIPAPGIHFLNWKGQWIRIERTREKGTSDITTGIPFETLTITTLTKLERKAALFKTLLEESRSFALKAYLGKTLVFTSWANEWRPFGQPRKKRPLSSVILDDGICEKLFSDITEFASASQWYYQRGIPYRRGYLLYGPPGTGKSSFIMALAGALDYNICIINLSENIMTDDRLQYLFSVVPERSFILLEDIDAAFASRSQPTSQQQGAAASQKVTFSGLLNAIDGIASSEERIIFMTTNHIERLDPALLRPGRVDVQQYFGNVTLFQASKMFLQFYPCSTSLVDEFVKKISPMADQISPAMIQGHFIQHKESAQEAIKASIIPP